MKPWQLVLKVNHELHLVDENIRTVMNRVVHRANRAGYGPHAFTSSEMLELKRLAESRAEIEHRRQIIEMVMSSVGLKHNAGEMGGISVFIEGRKVECRVCYDKDMNVQAIIPEPLAGVALRPNPDTLACAWHIDPDPEKMKVLQNGENNLPA